MAASDTNNGQWTDHLLLQEDATPCGPHSEFSTHVISCLQLLALLPKLLLPFEARDRCQEANDRVSRNEFGLPNQ